MKFNIWTYFTVLTSTLYYQASVLNDERPLHIGVSMNLGSRSHIKYLLEILQVLADKGHQITYLSMDYEKKYGNDYNVTHYSLGDVVVNRELTGNMMVPITSKDTLMKGIKEQVTTYIDYYENSFPVYEKFYNTEKPDLMICDFAATSCIQSAAKYTIPMMISFQTLQPAITTPYVTMGGVFDPTTIENYTFLQRMKHAIIDPIQLIIEYFPFKNAFSPLAKRNQIPTSYRFNFFTHLGLSIVNSFMGFENPRKIPSNFHLVGPILSDPIPELPQDLQLFLNKRSKVLYVSFGSENRLIPQLAENMLQLFQRALNNGVIDGIIWSGLAKTNYNDFPKTYLVNSQEYSTKSMIDSTHEDIKLLKWSPQESILNHPNTKLFLSHGGIESVYESLRAGTPILVLPFLADQPRNGMLVTENGVGDYIEWPTMSDEVIYQKFVKLLDENNLELHSKLHQMQLITKFGNRRKAMAADLIETYALSAKSCRSVELAIPFEIPCEMKPYLPLEYRMSSIKANLIDVYIVSFLLISAALLLFLYVIVKLILKLISITIVNAQIQFNTMASDKTKKE